MRLVQGAALAGALVSVVSAAVPLYFPGQISVAVPAPTGTVVGLDVTGDGRVDLIAGLDDGRLAIMENTGEGRFSLRETFEDFGGGQVVKVTAVELNAGGLPEVVLLTRNPDQVVVLEQTRSTPLLALTAVVHLDEDPQAVALGLYGQDGGVLLAVALPGFDRWVLVGERDGVWSVLQDVLAGDRPVSIAVVDLDEDGSPEVLTADNGVLAPGLSIYARDDQSIWSRVGGLALDGAPSAFFPFTDSETGAVTIYVAYEDRARIDWFGSDGGNLVLRGSMPSTLPAGGLHVARFATGETGLWAWNAERGLIDYFRDAGAGWAHQEFYYAGGRVVDGRLADVNQDSWPDLMIANGVSATVGLLFGNNLLDFRAYLATPLPGQPTAALLLDEDRDGHLDYLVSSYGSSSLEFLRGDGRGHLISDASSLPMPAPPLGLEVFHADADTLIDLVVALPAVDRAVVMRRLPEGGYEEVASVAAGNFPVKPVAGDLDADGVQDLVILNLLSSSMTLAYGAGDGTFPDVRTLSPCSRLEDLLLMELNADGLPEIVATNGVDLLCVLRNQGGRNFASPDFIMISGQPSNLAAGDLDGDLDSDLVICQRGLDAVGLLENNGTGFLRPRLLDWAVGGIPGDATIADLNLDGRRDLAVALVDRQEVAVLINLGAFNLTPPLRWVSALTPGALAAGDLNGDDVPDIALLDQTLDLALTMLNVEPNPVPIAPAPLAVDCDDGVLSARIALTGATSWTLEGETAAGWTSLAADGVARHGELARAPDGWLLRLSAADADAAGLETSAGAWLRLTTLPGGATALARAPAGCPRCPALGEPGAVVMMAPSPNPFNPAVECRFRLERPGLVSAAVVDMGGRVVADLGARWCAAGEHALAWEGRTESGPAASGTYLLRVTVEGRTVARKITLVQ